MLFKVLNGLKSCHGGEHTWTLGEWYRIYAEPIVCSRGFHVTENPAAWFKPGCTVYVAEIDGLTDRAPDNAEDSTKVAAQACRLIRPATDAELVERGIFLSGSHQACKGLSVVWGTASVIATGSASVVAYESSSVKAYDSSSVKAYGSATVRAYERAFVNAYEFAAVQASGSVSVQAFNSSSVTAHDTVRVVAYSTASVQAFDSAFVTAYDAASVEAYGLVSVTAYGSTKIRASERTAVVLRGYGRPTVTLEDEATEVSYLSTKPTFRTA
jgi:hypothetical protein